MTIQILSNRLEIVLPNNTNEGMPLFHETQLQTIAESFGGFTIIAQSGGREYGGKLYKDNSQRLIINFNTLSIANRTAIRTLIRYLFDDCGQPSVFFQINDVAMIMENTDTLSEALESYRNLKGGL